MKNFVALFVLLLTLLPLGAQTPMEMRLADVQTLLNGGALKHDTVFSASFLKQVSPEQLAMGVGGLTKGLGSCTSVQMVEPRTAYSGKAHAEMSAGFTVPVMITIQSSPPYRIDGLFLRPPVARATSTNGVIEALKELEGSTSLCAVNLSTGQVLIAHDTARYMPIGSTFKLYVLGAAVQQINSSKVAWRDVVILDSTKMSLPSGMMHEWPHGAPVTLYTLATMMISISDNTATDHLIDAVGRTNVEVQQKAMGHTDPPRNIPFLRTMDMFRLKYANNGADAHSYVGMNTAQKRALLERLQARTLPDTIEFVPSPFLPDSLEWFARTPDCVRALDWLRTASSSSTTSAALQILAVNPGIALNREEWTYVGYKGGSEPGVLNMSLLLRHRNGSWYAVSGSWLRTDADCDVSRFSALIGRTVQQIAP